MTVTREALVRNGSASHGRCRRAICAHDDADVGRGQVG
jgi:hypothetical protein